MAYAGEEAMPASLPDQNLFELHKLFVASDIKMSARSEVGRRQLLAFVVSSGDLSLRYQDGDPEEFPVMRHIPWFMDSDKRIVALCFDPSGTWLLVVAYDNSMFIIPALALVDSSAVLDHRWTTTDITSFPSSTNTLNSHTRSSHPTAAVWWQSVMDCQHSAIIGNERGDLIFFSLSTGTQVGITYVKSAITTLHICQDNSLDSVFLLITDDNRCQWKLMLEQRGTGYSWPIDSIVAMGSKGTTPNMDLSSSHSSIDLEFGSRGGPQYPTARSRLRGLKQLSVEKLAILRQKLAETRSKGVTSTGNSNIRRGSSSSSSDETTNNTIRRQSTDSSFVTTGPIPDKLSAHVGETFLQPQYTRGRYLLSGYYMPSSILTIHGMSLEVVPLFVHKLPPGCRDVLVTDRFLFVTNISGTSLSIVSGQLSESRLDGDMDHNPEAIIESYTFGENEQILNLYKCTEFNYQKKEDSSSADPNKSEKEGAADAKGQKTYADTKGFKPTKVECPPVDSCIILTNQGMHQVKVRRPATDIFLELVLVHQELERAERLALVFGLNLQELLEHAGDMKLAAKEFQQAIALYKLSRCRHLKSVLKFAAGGHSAELLSYINMLFSTSGLDLTVSERIHLSNLAVMSYSEQVLRNTTNKAKLFKQFLQFLRENLYYDEVLAVNVAGQTGLWEVLQFLAGYRGLHQEVLDILTKIMRSHGDAGSPKLPSTVDSGLWLCVTDPSLQQSLLAKPQQAKVHVNFVDTHLSYLEQFALQRLAALYDPSSPVFHFCLRRIFKVFRRRQSSGSSSSYSAHLDSNDFMDTSEELQFPMEHVIQTFLLVLLILVSKRQPGPTYNPDLMRKVSLQKEHEEEEVGDLNPTVPLQVCHLSSGFAHAALVRNGAVYTWGNAVQGCLGTGPTMSRYGSPQPISLFSSLMLEVSSVACGRQHTLALTNNGVYAWGSSQFGQLGIGKIVQSPYPRLVEGLAQERIVALSCGQYHSAALAHDGRLFTWGWGVHGQLGHGSVEDVHHPSLVKHLVGKVVTQVSGGHGHTVVLTAGGDVYTFGSSVFGQLGNGTNIKSSLPLLVTGIMEPITLVATGYFHNLAVSSSNKLYVWGSSPQALRLQAQAQKKARLLQQQTHLQSSREERDQQPAVLSVDSVTETCTSEISKSSSSLPVSGSGVTREGSPSSQCSVPGNGTDKTGVGRNRRSGSSQQVLPSSASSQGLATVQDRRSGAKDDDRLGSVDDRVVAAPSETQNPAAIVKSASLTLDKNILLTGGGSSIKSERLLNQEKNVMSCNVSSLPSILIDDEDLSKGISESSNLGADDVDLKSAFSPTLPTIVVSPTVEFKGLTAPPLATNMSNLAGRPGRPQAVRWEGDDSQAHLFPQLVDTSLISGSIMQISCGCHHSALLTREGLVYMWGRNLDGQVGNGSRKEVPIPTPLSATPTVSMKSPTNMPGGVIPCFERLQLQQVCCGCEFTTTLEAAGGKVWAWGNNSQAQVGIAPVEDSKPLEGKLVMLKTSKRVIKLPHGLHNACDLPREVPSVPVSNISFRAGVENQSRFTNERWPEGGPRSLCPPLCSIEQPCYGSHTLHYALQHFHGHYDSKLLLNKCLELENYQAAAKLSALDRNYHLALAYQLKALAVANAEVPPESHEGTEDSVNPSDEKTSGENKTKVEDNEIKTSVKNSNQGKDAFVGDENKTSETQNKTKNQKNEAKLPISTFETDHSNKDNYSKHLGSNEVNKGKDTRKDDSCKLSEKSVVPGAEVLPQKLHPGSSVVGVSEDCTSKEGLQDSTSLRRKFTEETRSLSVSSTPESLASVNNPDDSEMHTFAVQGGLEQMFEDKPYLTSPESSSPVVSENRTPLQSLNNDDLETSDVLTPVNKVETVPEKDKDQSVVSRLSKEDNSVFVMSDDQCTFSLDNSTVEDSSKRKPAENSSVITVSVDNKANSTTKPPGGSDVKQGHVVSNKKHQKSVDSIANATRKPKAIGSLKQLSDKKQQESVNSEINSPTKPVDSERDARHRELVAQASVVVDYYVSVMEEDSHTMMSQLLQQGFEFWLSHSLPVECLESLLLKHMAKFFYPLGLMLFCKGTVETDNPPDLCMLNHLSSRFCLQLCSTLLGHIQQKKPCPDYIELLAQATATNLAPTCGVNGCYQGATQTPEQVMEAILGRLGGLKDPGDASGQAYVTLNQETISLCGEDSSKPDQLVVFSCGHRYGTQAFHQTVLPELEIGLLESHRPLAHTAHALKGLFDASAPGIQLACPKCLLAHLQTQTT